MENKEFENQLKARRKAFGESLEGYAAEVEGYHEKNDMVRRDQVGGGWGRGGSGITVFEGGACSG